MPGAPRAWRRPRAERQRRGGERRAAHQPQVVGLSAQGTSTESSVGEPRATTYSAGSAGEVADRVGLARRYVEHVAGVHDQRLLELVAEADLDAAADHVERALAGVVEVRAPARAGGDAEHAHVDVGRARRGLRDLGPAEYAARDVARRIGGLDELHVVIPVNCPPVMLNTRPCTSSTTASRGRRRRRRPPGACRAAERDHHRRKPAHLLGDAELHGLAVDLHRVLGSPWTPSAASRSSRTRPR